jgi:hypothetical protein
MKIKGFFKKTMAAFLVITLILSMLGTLDFSKAGFFKNLNFCTRVFAATLTPVPLPSVVMNSPGQSSYSLGTTINMRVTFRYSLIY